MAKEKTLFNIGEDIETAVTALTNVETALILWNELVNIEGYQDPDKDPDISKAVGFAKRLPLYLAMFTSVLAAIREPLRDLKALSDRCYTGYFNQKKEDTPHAD